MRKRKLDIDLDWMVAEMERADKKYGPFRSTHEGLGVLIEEVHAELIPAIQANDRDQIALEAIQVAAVAMRIVQSLDRKATQKRSNLR